MLENKIMNEKERQNYIQQKLEKFADIGDFEGYFTLLPKSEHFIKYKELFDKIKPNQKYKIFRQIWTLNEGGFDIELYKQTIKFKHKRSKNVMKRKLNLLADTDGYLTIFRGINDYNNPDGFSWTINQEKALWFSTRFGCERGYVLKAYAHVDDVIDFIVDRNESEVIVSPDKIKTVKV